MALAIHPVVVGTAGHIDHGKSSLVYALTGIDPDRLKEEKERGLTIDLGFARMQLRDGRWVGLVDVPGHERFVRNMVAGATGLDLALLVVAADDGVMPQTIEHLDILGLLGVRGGLIVMTKIDLVDAALADLAEQEIRAAVAGTVFADAPVCRVSCTTGSGIAELRDAIESLALGIAPRPHGGAFRMPIQRIFSLPGIGTVITGIPVSGAVRQGEELEILPLRERVRVRGLQAYGRKVEQVVAGHSAALAVPDAKAAGVHRGMVACAPGVFAAGDAVDVELRLLPRSRLLPHRAQVRFHVGTIEVGGDLLLLDRARLAAGDSALVRIDLDQEVCCGGGDRFLLRMENPPVTVGGGTVLRLCGRRKRYRRRDLGAELEGLRAAIHSPVARLAHELSRAGPGGVLVADLARVLQSDEAAVAALVRADAGLHLHERGHRVFDRRDLTAGEQELLQSVERILARRPAAASIRRAALRTTRTLPQSLLEAVLDVLQAAGRVRSSGQGHLLFVERLQPLPPAQQQQLDALVAACTEGGFRPPDPLALQQATGLDGESLLGLLDRAQDEGLIERVGAHCYGAAVLRRAMHAVRRNCLRHGGMLDIPSLRDELDTSRKFLIPLLEHIDAQGLTVLRGGNRWLLLGSDLNRTLAAETGAGGAEAGGAGEQPG